MHRAVDPGLPVWGLAMPLLYGGGHARAPMPSGSRRRRPASHCRHHRVFFYFQVAAAVPRACSWNCTRIMRFLPVTRYGSHRRTVRPQTLPRVHKLRHPDGCTPCGSDASQRCGPALPSYYHRNTQELAVQNISNSILSLWRSPKLYRDPIDSSQRSAAPQRFLRVFRRSDRPIPPANACGHAYL